MHRRRLCDERWWFDGVDCTLVHDDPDLDTRGKAAMLYQHQPTYIYSGETLHVLTETPSATEDLGGSCGQNPPHIELRTRPRISSAEFGFDLQATDGDIAFFCLSDQTGSLPLGNCTLLLSSSLTPLFSFVDASADRNPYNLRGQ